MCQSKCINYYNVFHKQLTSESMRTGACISHSQRRREELLMLVKDDMCGSCFSKTKYTCRKCQIPICNKYSTFEDNEASSRWTAEKCVAYCEPCFKEKTLEQKRWWKNRTAQEARWSRLKQITRKVCFAIVIVKL